MNEWTEIEQPKGSNRFREAVLLVQRAFGPQLFVAMAPAEGVSRQAARQPSWSRLALNLVRSLTSFDFSGVPVTAAHYAQVHCARGASSAVTGRPATVAATIPRLQLPRFGVRGH